jgi:uncharacterized protein YndB with AHSA1/START domain
MKGVDVAERIDQIRREVVLNAPIERVWQAVTSSEEISKWFGDVVEVDLQPGGKAKFGWSDYGDVFEAIVVEVKEPTRFSFSWAFDSNVPYDDATARLVEIDLAAEGDNTRLTLVESGFAQLPDDLYQKRLDANSGGWDSELADLVDYLDFVRAS